MKFTLMEEQRKDKVREYNELQEYLKKQIIESEIRKNEEKQKKMVEDSIEEKRIEIERKKIQDIYKSRRKIKLSQISHESPPINVLKAEKKQNNLINEEEPSSSNRQTFETFKNLTRINNLNNSEVSNTEPIQIPINYNYYKENENCKQNGQTPANDEKVILNKVKKMKEEIHRQQQMITNELEKLKVIINRMYC